MTSQARDEFWKDNRYLVRKSVTSILGRSNDLRTFNISNSHGLDLDLWISVVSELDKNVRKLMEIVNTAKSAEMSINPPSLRFVDTQLEPF